MRTGQPRPARRVRAVGLVAAAVAATALLLGPGLPTAAGQPGHRATAATGSTASTGSTKHMDFPAMPKGCREQGNPLLPTDTCHITSYGEHRPIVVAFGDSHVWMYLPALKKAAVRTHTNLVAIFAGGCPPVLPEPKTADQPRTGCELHDARALHYIERLESDGRQVRVLVGAWWEGYHERWRNIQASSDPDATWNSFQQRTAEIAVKDTKALFDTLGFYAIPTDIIEQPGSVPYLAHACAAGRDPYRCTLSRRAAIPKEAANRAWLERQLTGLTSRGFTIDPTPAYCTSRVCHGVVDGRNVFYDADHLGAGFTSTLTSYFLPTFRAAAG